MMNFTICLHYTSQWPGRLSLLSVAAGLHISINFLLFNGISDNKVKGQLFLFCLYLAIN